jgi:hypothetical protein
LEEIKPNKENNLFIKGIPKIPIKKQSILPTYQPNCQFSIFGKQKQPYIIDNKGCFIINSCKGISKNKYLIVQGSCFGLFGDKIEPGQLTQAIDILPKKNWNDTNRIQRYKIIIDANDKVRLGYSVTAPELYYSFHLGAEYKGLGLDMMFQGVGRYSAMLNTQGYYWGLISNSSMAQQVYDNRWSPTNNVANAEYPRLSSESNANNYQTSDFWLRDRSYLKLRNIELYYHLPKCLLEKTKIIKAAKVYLRGIDLFTFDHLDEVDAAAYSATTPLTRSIALGVSVTL